MTACAKLPEGAIEVVLKEYDHLKEEVRERLRTAFSHVAYGGAIAAFAVPAADQLDKWRHGWIVIAAAAIAAIALFWVAALNMRWVQHCGKYMCDIEARINAHFGLRVVGWEHYASGVQASLWCLIPDSPDWKQPIDDIERGGRYPQPAVQVEEGIDTDRRHGSP